MSKTRLFSIISSIVIWIPVIIVALRIPLIDYKAILLLMYILLLICPIVSVINIIIGLFNLYKIKALSVSNIMLLLSNILFLTLGMKYFKEIAWIV